MEGRDERVPLGLKLVYGAPSFAGAAMTIPIAIHMTKFYADTVLVPLGFLGIAIAIARAFDALTDPFIGWLSDRTRTRWGRRRPFIVVGAPLAAVAFWALFSPPVGMSERQAIVWFTTSFVLYFLFHTVYVIPHYALGPELTLDYHERSSLFGVREGFSILGTVVAALAPGVMTVWLHDERRAFSLFSVVFGAILVVLYAGLVVKVRERPEFYQREPNPVVPGVRRALRNGPFRILLATYVVASIPGAIPGTLMPFYNAYVIRPENPPLWLAIFLATYFGSGFLCLPLWVRAAHRFGKRATWLASFAMGISGGAAMFLLGPGDELPLLALLAWAGSSFGAGLFLAPAIQADVIDYDELHTGKRREAQYAAFWSILPKFVLIPSAAIPIAFLGSIGYVPNAPEQSSAVTLAIRAIFSLTPAFFSLISFFIAWRLPIDEAMHRAILRGIECHGRGEPALDPLTGRWLAPPAERGAGDEATWFLDHFSPGELRRVLSRGPRRALRDVALAAGLSLAALVASLVFVLEHVTSLHTDPGPLTVIAVVGVGLALASLLFHLMRLPAARRLARGQVQPEILRRHLAG